jgi:hypothetical protein
MAPDPKDLYDYGDWRNHFPILSPEGEELAIVQALAAHGLAVQVIDGAYAPILDHRNMQDSMIDVIRSVVNRDFGITFFGIDFLKYFGLLKSDSKKEPTN